MTVETIPLFHVVCNGCGESASEDRDFYAWSTGDALDVAAQGGWLIRDDGHWCTDCQHFDAEDHITPRVPESGEKIP